MASYMNPIVATHQKSGNGRHIGTRVVRVDEDGTKNCYRAEVNVDSARMAYSHHDDRASAEAWANMMADAYMVVHA